MPSADPESARSASQFHVPRIVFLGEQDGAPERELKTRLAQLLAVEQAVSRGYLARVAYGDSTTHSVALCLRHKVGPDEGLVDKVRRIFASMFGRHEHLDIIFRRGRPGEVL